WLAPLKPPFGSMAPLSLWLRNHFMDEMAEKARTLLSEMERWLEAQGYRGWDPHDGLNSPWVKAATLDRHWLGVVGLQVIRRSPLNLRPFLGVPKTYHAKAMGLFLSAFARKYLSSKDVADLRRMEFFTDWLLENASPGFSGLCWGYPFDWPNRQFYARKGTPTIVNTSFIAHAFLDAYEVTGEAKYLQAARSSCGFLLHDLNRIKKGNAFCFSYTPGDHNAVHNANMLGASLLARVGAITKDRLLREAAEASMDYSLEAQRLDGAWYYGEAPNERWIDSFHTGYSLVALADFLDYSGRGDLKPSLERGFQFYLDHFFLLDGTVKYYDKDAYPLEAHCFAHALIGLRRLAFLEEGRVQALLPLVFGRMVQLFWSGRGYFFSRRTRWFTDRTPYLRWVQAWAFLALAHLAYPDL
ncbi:MAG: hypothetical protein ABIN58_10940, partial [candidate division WOR-3 bacterium]